MSTVIAGCLLLAVQSLQVHYTGRVVFASTALPASTENATAIKPFRVNVPEAELAELRRRVLATRWPDRETVTDQSQGIQLEKLQGLVRYWGTDYDWRKIEAKLNALPQFTTTIDGVDIHFIHVRTRHPNALPVIAELEVQSAPSASIDTCARRL